MQTTFPIFRSKPQLSNIVAKNFELVLFTGVITYLTVSFMRETGPVNQIIKGVYLGVSIVFGIFFFIRLMKEPTFITVTPDGFTIRPSFYLLKKQISSAEIRGFSLINRPFAVNRGRTTLNYNAYLLYLSNGKKIILTEYYFVNFNELSNALRKAGIEFLGKEDRNWSWWRKRTKYDK